MFWFSITTYSSTSEFNLCNFIQKNTFIQHTDGEKKVLHLVYPPINVGQHVLGAVNFFFFFFNLFTQTESTLLVQSLCVLAFNRT